MGRKQGKVAGCVLGSKAIQIMLDGKRYPAHKLAFLYMENKYPEEVDHRDTNPSNNQWNNLREATHSQNMLNRKVMGHSMTGIKNVHYRKDRNTYCVTMTVNGKRKVIGHRKDIKLAEQLAIEARNEYHGDYARHS